LAGYQGGFCREAAGQTLALAMSRCARGGLREDEPRPAAGGPSGGGGTEDTGDEHLFAKFPSKSRPNSQMKSSQVPKQKSAKFPNDKTKFA